MKKVLYPRDQVSLLLAGKQDQKASFGFVDKPLNL